VLCACADRSRASRASIVPDAMGGANTATHLRRGCERNLPGGYDRVILVRLKTAISLPDDTFRRVDHAAKRLGVSRSEFFSRAAENRLAALEDGVTTEAINDCDRRTPSRSRVHRRGCCGLGCWRSGLMTRGELWWADLGLPRGSAPALRRPVLVVSATVS
jgi:predicted DNA-binding protein